MNRNHSLDVLRGIAVLAVIVHHYAGSDDSLLHIGGVGVDLFFVLSGFLISSLLFSEIRNTGRLRLGRFLIRRGLKIYPAFYLFLAITLPLVPSNEYGRLWGEVFFLQQYAPHVWQHTWTLSVEETFYVAAPLAIALLYRWNRLRWFPAIAIVIVCGLTVLRIAGTDPIRFEGLALGSLLGYFHNFHADRFRQCVGWWNFPAVVLFLLPLAIAHRGNILFTCTTIAFSFAVSWAAVHPMVSVRGLVTIGQYSYSIYLWHMVVAMMFSSLIPHNIFGLSADVLFTLAIGIGMSMLIEVPVLKLRDRIFPSASRAVVLIPNSAASLEGLARC